ncbi:15119_t:CDS:2 [Dentiscutata erythropus]|uniref:15119_t:CDS:1 n=1 Tax=Dentiscutata erythropus TaxID=1348616 RepID=A0A9N9B7G1_9GLOM|nr:15119_t:CDS:2 [Dentiscutata erythropus]
MNFNIDYNFIQQFLVSNPDVSVYDAVNIHHYNSVNFDTHNNRHEYFLLLVLNYKQRAFNKFYLLIARLIEDKPPNLDVVEAISNMRINEKCLTHLTEKFNYLQEICLKLCAELENVKK